MTHAVLRLLCFHNEWGNTAINLNGSVRMEIIPLPLPHLGSLASHVAPSSAANWLLHWEIKGLVCHGTKCDSVYINVYSIYVNWHTRLFNQASSEAAPHPQRHCADLHNVTERFDVMHCHKRILTSFPKSLLYVFQKRYDGPITKFQWVPVSLLYKWISIIPQYYRTRYICEKTTSL